MEILEKGFMIKSYKDTNSAKWWKKFYQGCGFSVLRFRKTLKISIYDIPKTEYIRLLQYQQNALFTTN